MMIVLIYIL